MDCHGHGNDGITVLDTNGRGPSTLLPAGVVCLAVFGYVTATLATYFVGRDAESTEAELAGAEDVRALREELQALRAELRAVSRQQPEN